MLPADLAREMTKRNPRARVVEVKGCGHAPPLMRSEQIGCVSEFLNA
jgi:pimeloyl-ACP methyl ester carboxylesterase